MIGYPQCSMLLSTAYVNQDGKLYFYSTYNGKPGGISMITVEPNDPESAVLTELYDAEGYEQYCISSLICSTDGIIYYKNDSGNVLAVGTKAAPAYPITLQTTPANAKVIVTKDGAEVKAGQDGNYSLTDGTYRYTVSADGYQSKTGSFTVSAAAQTVSVALEQNSPTAPSNPTPDDKITVTFRLIGATKSSVDVDVGSGKGDSEYQSWIKTTTYTLDKGAKVYDLFTKALNNAGLSYTGAEKNYVDTIWAPMAYGGYSLSEFTNGPRSGWMYTRNGKHPDLGLKEQTFDDVDGNQYYANAVRWAEQNSIVRGISVKTFGPNADISREQMAAILYRYAQHKKYDTTKTYDLATFADADSVSDYATAAMQWASGTALIMGTDSKTLLPAGNATRAQVATILMRFINNTER